MPILAMKLKPSKSPSSTVRALRASALMSLGLIPRADSMIARSVPREISAALAWPSVVPVMTMRSQNLRFTCGPSTTTNSRSSISQAPSLLRLRSPPSPAPPGRMVELEVATVPSGISSILALFRCGGVIVSHG